MMRTRILYIIKLYLAIVTIFISQKTVFMMADAPEGNDYGVAQWMEVITNGLLLDVPMTGYIVALPLIAIMATVWIGKEIRLRRVVTPYYILIAIAVGTIFVSDLALYPFWQFKLDALAVSYLESPGGAFASVSAGFVVLHVVYALLATVAITVLLVYVTPTRLYAIKSKKERWLMTAGFVLLLPAYVISIRGGVGESTANIGKVYFSSDTFLNHAAVNPTFSLIYSLDKTDDYASEFDYFDEEERAKIVDGLLSGTPTTTTASPSTPLSLNDSTATPPNIIVILMEGFGGQFVEAVSGRKDITPNYNRLAREGILFTNCYSNSFRTDRGMLSTLSGYPAFPTLSVMKIPAKSRSLPCIASTLKEKGYENTFLYGGDINFTNMQSYLRTGGYETIVSDVDFSADEKKQNPWGANDDITFNRLYDIVSGKRHEPWHVCYLTLSSHEPWVVPYKRFSDPVPNAFAFTDKCLGDFVEKIRKTPLWDNLLIVCIPDHGYHYPEDISHATHHHNTMLWIGGRVKQHKVVDTIMNQSDMAATLLGSLGIDHSAYTFSRDILSPTYTYPYAFFTFKEGIGFADSTGCSVYDIISDRQMEDHPAAKANNPAATQERIKKAKALLQTIYDDIGKRGINK